VSSGISRDAVRAGRDALVEREAKALPAARGVPVPGGGPARSEAATLAPAWPGDHRRRPAAGSLDDHD